jgi:hypothetical protein
MIKGHATIEATADYATRYAPVSYVTLDRTGLKASQAGFGGYRISSGVSRLLLIAVQLLYCAPYAG